MDRLKSFAADAAKQISYESTFQYGQIKIFEDEGIIYCYSQSTFQYGQIKMGG